MKKNIVLAAFVALFAFAISASAQSKCVNFSGDWKQDLNEQMATRLESVTLTIKHDCAAGTFETTRVNKPKADAPAPPAGGPGGGGGRMGGGAAGPQSYKLDGKEVEVERQTPNGAIKIKTKAEQNGNKITITTVAPGQDGSPTTRTTTYELSSDGKGLTQSGGQMPTTYKKA